MQAGTLVVQGDGIGLVCATGARTALGQIGGTLGQIEPRPSRVQSELKRVVARVGAFALLASVAAALLYAGRQGSWIDGLLDGLTLAMAILPEGSASLAAHPMTVNLIVKNSCLPPIVSDSCEVIVFTRQRLNRFYR